MNSAAARLLLFNFASLIGWSDYADEKKLEKSFNRITIFAQEGGTANFTTFYLHNVSIIIIIIDLY